MIKDKIIIIPFGWLWDWPADYEKQTALTLAKKNKVIAFLFGEGLSLKNYLKFALKRQKKNLLERFGRNFFKFRPLYLLPFQRFKIIQKINFFLSVWQLKLLLLAKKRWKNKGKILWLFTPQLSLKPSWFGQDFFSLYDCVDSHSSIDTTKDKLKKEEEKKLIKKVDIVFTNSPVLYRLKKPLGERVFQVPQGCNTDLFFKMKKLSFPQDLKKIPPPQIGFIGNLDYRLDYKLIKKLALRNPHWSFVFVGPRLGDPVQDEMMAVENYLEILKILKNIYFLGSKGKPEVVRYLDNFEVCLTPYNLDLEFVRYSYPMKVFEYFCRGKPVVSTPIKSLIPLQPYVQLAKNAQEFEQKIKKILKSGWPQNYKRVQRKLAIANSWEAKIEKISEILKKEFPEKF